MKHTTLLAAGLLLAGLTAAPARAEIQVRGAQRSAPRSVPAAIQRAPVPSAASTKHAGYAGSTSGYGSSTKYGGYGNGYGHGGGPSYGFGAGGGLQLGYTNGQFGIGVSLGSCAPARQWIPGSWQHRSERFWVPERCERVWRDALYETRYDSCGQPYRVCVQSAGWTSVTYPGYWDTRSTRFWVAGRWSY